MSRRTPQRSVAEGVGDLDGGPRRVVLEVHQHGDVDGVLVAVGERAGGGDGVPAVGGDQRVRHGPDAAAAPPGGLGVGRDADRAGDVRRPAVAGLDEPVVVAGGEEHDVLAAGGVDDGPDVAHDQRAAGHAAEVDGLEVRELGVVALDRHDGLARLDPVALVEGVDDEVVPRRHPHAVGADVPGADLQDRDRLVHPTEQRLLLLEDLHQDPRMPVLGLQQLLGRPEVRVAVVPRAQPADRQLEGGRVESQRIRRHRREPSEKRAAARARRGGARRTGRTATAASDGGGRARRRGSGQAVDEAGGDDEQDGGDEEEGDRRAGCGVRRGRRGSGGCGRGSPGIRWRGLRGRVRAGLRGDRRGRSRR